MIIRDGLYWLPLIQLTVGPRPEEPAALRKDSIQVRDGILCFVFDIRPDVTKKTKASERVVPVPDILLRLGFAEWWRAQLALPGELLFPELPSSEVDGTTSDPFGKQRRRIYEHLGIRDPHEDFYAGRMTVATELLALGAQDHVRQSTLGHEHDSVINRHYTQATLDLIKSYLDQIDLGLIIEFDPRYGFPVIRGCSLLDHAPVRVSLTLGGRERPKCIEVWEPDTDVTHRITADETMDLDDRAAVAANLDRMGRALAEILAGRRYRIEGIVDQPVERALGVLLALAFTGERAPKETDSGSESTQAIGNGPGQVPRSQAAGRLTGRRAIVKGGTDLGAAPDIIERSSARGCG
jgi:hypothetical protein